MKNREPNASRVPGTESPAGGLLYVVGTPIGNLRDISLRALDVLGEVDLIAAEDTRHTRKLLSHYNIHTPLFSCYEHNQALRLPYILAQLRDGRRLALVSNAGMPGISDPGYPVIRAALGEGFPVIPIPGPSALLLGIVVSGIDPGRFVFEGFLGRTRAQRRRRLQFLAVESRTIVLYEAPHRIRKLLAEVEDILGNRRIALARELSKRFEEVIRGSVSEVRSRMETSVPRGEFTVIIAGRSD